MTGARPCLLRAVLTVVLLAGLLAVDLQRSEPPATAAMTDMPAAVQAGVNNAAAKGITQYVAVIDRRTGQVVANTANASQQVASESVMKLFIAIYYLRAYRGVLPVQMERDLGYMIRVSDDAIASRYWTAGAIPTVASAYGLTGSANDPSRPGYWGAARITANDMAKLLWMASNDPTVAPWLFRQMQMTTDVGSDGYNQNFGFNAVAGAGSKQGWGCDSYWVGPCAVHSIGFTNNVVAAVLQTAPSSRYSSMRPPATTTATLIANVQPNQLPVGTIDSILSEGSAVQLSGWALDPDVLGAGIPVAVYRDGVGISWFPTDQLRPDVNAVYGATGTHGFQITLTNQPSGPHTYCVYGIDQGGSNNPLLACRTVHVGAPIGQFESVAASIDGSVTLSGWALDLDTPGTSIPVAVYRNGDGISWFPADRPRPDVNSFLGVSGSHGFTITLANQPTGTSSYCVYAIDQQSSSHPALGCRTVAVGPVRAPIGQLDSGGVTSGTAVSLNGWALDQDAPSVPISVAVHRDGVEIGRFSTAADRPDVNAAFSTTGRHGYAIQLDNEPLGTHRYCTYAIDNEQFTPAALLGCQQIAVGLTPPVGNFESAEILGGGRIVLRGWALDQDAPTASIPVAVYRDGGGISWFPTDLQRPDVNAYFATTGTHGFQIELTGQPPGQHTYCVYAIDNERLTANPSISCHVALVS